MWKFENFASTQILREIDFCNSKTLKNVILINQKAMNIKFWQICSIIWGQNSTKLLSRKL